MAKIILNQQQFEIDGIVFDKDGTLIDFNATWGPILRRAVKALTDKYPNQENLSRDIFKTLGVEPMTMTALDGPYSICTVDKIYTVIAAVMYQHGIGWSEAEERVAQIIKPAAETPPGLEQLSPTADLPKFFGNLQQKGLNIAIATADNKRGTLSTLQKLQCDIDSILLACGDDLSLPNKPDPELLHQIAAIWDTTASKIAMVGDTIGDVYMAQQAGAISIGVLTGAANRETLQPYSHAVLDSIEQIQIVY